MKKEIKDFKQDNAGRSMTEMLGVLAIIGVLSLGGIIGYKLAMNRYAANQIAYEINMMKTDAKVKIMQGNDRLTLGQPYDGDSEYLGSLNYNENYFVDFNCALRNGEFIDDASCKVANAYYIEVKNIPEEVCRPLANLINGMSELISFEVTKSDDENSIGENCYEGNNDLFAAFSAEPKDSDLVVCESEENNECPENASHCDVNRHVCVECINNAQCLALGKDPHCHTATGTCEPCPDGSSYNTTYKACAMQITPIYTDIYAVCNNYVGYYTKNVTNLFGPFTHSYKVWVNAQIDDYAQFYVNNESVNTVRSTIIGNHTHDCRAWYATHAAFATPLKKGEKGGLRLVSDLSAHLFIGTAWLVLDGE